MIGTSYGRQNPTRQVVHSPDMILNVSRLKNSIGKAIDVMDGDQVRGTYNISSVSEDSIGLVCWNEHYHKYMQTDISTCDHGMAEYPSGTWGPRLWIRFSQERYKNKLIQW